MKVHISNNEQLLAKICSVIYDRKGMYEAALEQSKKNQASQKIKFGIKRSIMNWEELFESDREDGKGFLLDETVNYNNLDNENYMIESSSIMSYKFGIRSNDTKTIQAKRFRCICGYLEGEYAGVKCPKCGSETQNRYAIRGWWQIKNFKIFNPDWLSVFMAHLNTKVISRDELKNNLYQTSSRKNRTGYNIIDLQNRENLVAFINEYAADDARDYFMANIDCAMSNKIPCISKDYRYYSVVNRIEDKPSIKNHELNKYYIMINDSVRDLNLLGGRESSATIARHLNRINTNLLSIYEVNKHSLGGNKESYIRGKVAGRRKHYSGRMVVEALLHPRVDVCTIPYSVFGEFTIDYHKDLYIKYGMTAESENRMRNNYPSTSDKIIMIKVLKELKASHLNTVFIYRAPCLYKGSVLGMEIIGLTNADVIRVNDISLDIGLKGDKDGDMLGVFLLNPEVRQTIFYAFNPKRLIFDPIKGEINSGYELVESFNYVAYELLNDGLDHSNEVLTTDDMKKLGLL